MAKIFEFNKGQKGTLIDSVSKTAGTLTAGNGGFKKTEKGQAMLFDGSATKITYGAKTLSGDFSVCVIIKTGDKTGNDLQPISSSDGDFQPTRIRSNIWTWFLRDSSGNTLTDSTPQVLTDNRYHLLILTYDKDGNVLTIIDNDIKETIANTNLTSDILIDDLNVGFGAVVDYMQGFVAKAEIYDTVLTQSERNELYKEFLQSYGTEKPTTNFTYQKPTDLSKEVDSVVGEQLLDEPEFNATGDWDLIGTFTISNGKLNCVSDGTYYRASQADILTVGKKYRITAICSEWSSGTVRLGNSGVSNAFVDGEGFFLMK
jgi:hypothetical protein